MDNTYRVNQQWEQLANRVVRPEQIVMVIGPTDVGKSTFCRFLADSAVSRGLKTAVVDTDIGQSQIGPPTTIGLKTFAPGSSPVRFNEDAESLYFVGALSPSGHALEMLTGVRLMLARAREISVDFIVVDTTGYIHDVPAVQLKQHKIELLRPNHLVCIGRASELEPITAYYRQLDWLDIHGLQPHRSVRSRSRKSRIDYRKSQFDTYFGLATPAGETGTEAAFPQHENSLQLLPFAQVRGRGTPFFSGRVATAKELETLTGLVGTPVYYAEWGHRRVCLIVSKPLPSTATAHIKSYLSLTGVTAEVRASFHRRLVGLIDAAGDTYAIGIIEDIDIDARGFRIRCQTGAPQRARAIQFGDYRVK